MSDMTERERIELRIEVVTAILWAVENGPEVLELLAQSTDRRLAVAAVMSAQGFSEFAAEHVMDIPFSLCSQRGRQHLRDELDDLRRALADGA